MSSDAREARASASGRDVAATPFANMSRTWAPQPPSIGYEKNANSSTAVQWLIAAIDWIKRQLTPFSSRQSIFRRFEHCIRVTAQLQPGLWIEVMGICQGNRTDITLEQLFTNPLDISWRMPFIRLGHP